MKQAFSDQTPTNQRGVELVSNSRHTALCGHKHQALEALLHSYHLICIVYIYRLYLYEESLFLDPVCRHLSSTFELCNKADSRHEVCCAEFKSTAGAAAGSQDENRLNLTRWFQFSSKGLSSLLHDSHSCMSRHPDTPPLFSASGCYSRWGHPIENGWLLSA